MVVIDDKVKENIEQRCIFINKLIVGRRSVIKNWQRERILLWSDDRVQLFRDFRDNRFLYQKYIRTCEVNVDYSMDRFDDGIDIEDNAIQVEYWQEWHFLSDYCFTYE
jgi:hypothetical protein